MICPHTRFVLRPVLCSAFENYNVSRNSSVFFLCFPPIITLISLHQTYLLIVLAINDTIYIYIRNRVFRPKTKDAGVHIVVFLTLMPNIFFIIIIIIDFEFIDSEGERIQYREMKRNRAETRKDYYNIVVYAEERRIREFFFFVRNRYYLSRGLSG